MPSFETKQEIVCIDNISLSITSLADRNQFYDPHQEAKKLGISDSMWPISGLVWPAGIVLARVINRLNLASVSVLEVGCGIGIASLIAAQKKADITANDYHPIVNPLLTKNAEANDINHIKFLHGNWNQTDSNDRKFDLIIGSDLLYETGSAEILAVYINSHLALKGKVILLDPGRRAAGKIRKEMEALGFICNKKRLDEQGNEKKNGYFTQYSFQKH